MTRSADWGPNHATFVLFTTTNVTTPQAQWTPIQTNAFDEFGVFYYTNLFSRSWPRISSGSERHKVTDLPMQSAFCAGQRWTCSAAPYASMIAGQRRSTPGGRRRHDPHWSRRRLIPCGVPQCRPNSRIPRHRRRVSGARPTCPRSVNKGGAQKANPL